jgi:hypothetical protein
VGGLELGVNYEQYSLAVGILMLGILDRSEELLSTCRDMSGMRRT